MNNGMKTRSKMAEKVRHHKSNRRPTDTHGANDTLRSKRLLGECPPFVDKEIWVNDSIEKKSYMVGGIRDKQHIPTSDFYCLDFEGMKWTNLTDSLRYRDMDSPFSAENGFKRIPRLSQPGCTLFRLHHTSYLFVFGGYDDDLKQTSPRLIVINLRNLEWWYQPVLSGVAAGRIDPTVVAIGRKLYIFGGYRHFKTSETCNGGPHTSYSIASLSDDDRTWSWELRDISYPEHVPKGTIFTQATAIYNGAKILLSPWRTTEKTERDLINFKEDNIYCFHIQERKFQRPLVFGDFPKNLSWYFVLPMPSPPALAPDASKSSVIICGWMDWVDDTIIPEIWHFELTSPIERIRKLDVAPIVDRIDSQQKSEPDLRSVVMNGDRLFLLGSRPDSEGSVSEDELTYNAYFEVPLRRLCTKS